MEIWTLGLSHPAVAARQAASAEADGFDGWYCVDSQNLSGDVYVGLALAAAATERIGLGPGVTNPVTRHPAATAAGIGSIQVASGGRAVLGIGRGDSSLAHVGRAPARVDDLARALRTIQAYLRGDDVDFADLPDGAPPVADLALADAPPTSRLHWIGEPKVPVEVAATGPRVLALAAEHADRVLLAVGADPDRQAWAIETIRAVDPDVAIGAFVNVACHDDLDVARRLVSGGLSTFARFNVMHGRIHGPATAAQRDTLDRLRQSYDMTEHTRVGSAQARALDDDFVDRFAVVGPPSRVAERLHGMRELGIDKLVVIGPTAGADPEAARHAHRRFVAEVLPQLGSGGSAPGAPG